MKVRLITLALSLGVIALCAEAFGQGMGRGRGMGGDSRYQRFYDVNTVETVEGEVSNIDIIAPGRGLRQGVHLQLKSKDGDLSVHLGPKWFLDEQDIQIEKGDLIKVKGSRVTFDDKPAIIVAEIEQGDEIFLLRDEKGFPAWAGSGRRNR